jgi:hypothetical protein
MGIISAARRQAARDEWTVMAAMAEYASRHSGTKPLDEFAADKLAFELHLTPLSAAERDPEAVRKRKEAGKRQTHVRPFRENSGSAGMVARELPSDEVLASWQHVEQRALDLRAAGVPGSLPELRVRAYFDLLQERDSRDPAAAPRRRRGSRQHPGPAARGHPAARPRI